MVGLQDGCDLVVFLALFEDEMTDGVLVCVPDLGRVPLVLPRRRHCSNAGQGADGGRLRYNGRLRRGYVSNGRNLQNGASRAWGLLNKNAEAWGGGVPTLLIPFVADCLKVTSRMRLGGAVKQTLCLSAREGRRGGRETAKNTPFGPFVHEGGGPRTRPLPWAHAGPRSSTFKRCV